MTIQRRSIVLDFKDFYSLTVDCLISFTSLKGYTWIVVVFDRRHGRDVSLYVSIITQARLLDRAFDYFCCITTTKGYTSSVVVIAVCSSL